MTYSLIKNQCAINKRLRQLGIMCLLAAILGTPWVAVGEALSLEAKAREIFETKKHAAVTIQMVINMRFSMGGNTQERENNVEVTGTVISPDGKTVVALSAADPSALMRTMSDDDIQMSIEINDVKIMLPDGDEIDAQVVLRDNDLDLAFIMPLERPESPMTYASLDEIGEPELFDQVLAINRLGRVANRVYSGSLERIEAIVERPRKYYIPGSEPTNTDMGCPAFTLDGDFVGIFVVRAVRDTGGSGSNMMPILVPADEIAYAAEQAPGFDD